MQGDGRLRSGEVERYWELKRRLMTNYPCRITLDPFPVEGIACHVATGPSSSCDEYTASLLRSPRKLDARKDEART